MGQAERFIEENETTNKSFNPSNVPTSNSQLQPHQASSSQPPKLKRKKLRSVESVSFQKILKRKQKK